MIRSALTILALACAFPLAASAAMDAPTLGPLPTSFTGTLPCADCDGVDWRLDLFADGAFYVRRIYRGHDGDGHDEIGTWRFDAATGRLALSGAGDGAISFELVDEDELRLLDRDGRPIASDLDYSLRRTGDLNGLEPRLKMRGQYSYWAEAALFVECRTQRRLPVWPGGDNLALEQAYREAGDGRGEPILVEVDGRIAWLPPMEGEGLVPTLVVEEFLGIHPDDTCDAAHATADLLETYWKLTQLEGQPVRAGGPRSEPHLVLGGDGQFKAYDGCNRLLGGFRSIGESLEFSGVVSTKMACPGAPVVAGYADALERVATYRISDRSLELMDEGGLMLARFDAVFAK